MHTDTREPSSWVESLKPTDLILISTGQNARPTGMKATYKQEQNSLETHTKHHCLANGAE